MCLSINIAASDYSSLMAVALMTARWHVSASKIGLCTCSGVLSFQSKNNGNLLSSIPSVFVFKKCYLQCKVMDLFFNTKCFFQYPWLCMFWFLFPPR